MSRYWQIAAGSAGREYAGEFLRYGMAFVGGDRQCEAMRTVENGDVVLLKRGRSELVAAGRVVARGGLHRGEGGPSRRCLGIVGRLPMDAKHKPLASLGEECA